jgi:hypothetical protein
VIIAADTCAYGRDGSAAEIDVALINTLTKLRWSLWRVTGVLAVDRDRVQLTSSGFLVASRPTAPRRRAVVTHRMAERTDSWA